MPSFLSYALVVFEQVSIIFLLVLVGFLCGRTHLINDTVSKGLTDLTLKFATPAMILNSFIRPFDKTALKQLLWAFGLALLFHGFFIALSYLTGAKDDGVRRVKRFSVIFGNAGFMGLPLQLAIIGEDGCFFGSVFVVVFNIIIWSYGVALMGGSSDKISARKILLNPCILCIPVGLLLFLTNACLVLPDAVTKTVSHIANLNTPLPMFVIGYFLSKSRLVETIKDHRTLWPSILRLIVCPLSAIAFFMLCPVDKTIALSLVISVAAPSAAMTAMFAAEQKRDTLLSANLVSTTTLYSIVTMPVMVALAQAVL